MQHEKLDVYKEARQFAQKMMELGEKRYPFYEFNNQVLAAALSTPLNMAEGCWRRCPKERAHFCSIARDSMAECASFWTWPST
jgi:four helix bundle protein